MIKRFLLSLALLVAGFAHADWAADRDASAGYVTVTVLASAVDEAVPFCVVYLSDLPADFHTAMTAASDTDGKTIRVSTSDGVTELACVPIGVNTGTDTGCLIFLATGMSASVDVDYRIYVGNAALTMPAASAGEQLVFAAYAGVYFPGVSTRDWTSGGRTLTAVNSPGTAASGYEGITAATYATNKYHHYSNASQAVTDWPVTLEAIGYTTSTTLDQSFISLCSSSDNNPHAGLTATSSNKASAYFRGNPTSSASQSTSTGSLTTSTYYYLAGSRDDDSGTSRLYVDGTASTTNTGSIVAPTFNRVAIGAWARPSVIWPLSGNVAVALLSSSVRSADYMSTMQDNWAGTMYTAGAWVPASDCGSGGTGLVLFGGNSQTSTANENWNDLGASLIDDATTTDVTLDDAGVYESETITYNGADLSGVPTDATSYTVTIHIKKKADTTGGKETNDLVIRFRDGSGTLVGDNLAEIAVPWPATATTVEYPLTGYTPDGTDFTSSTGVDVQATGFDTNGATLAEILTVWIEVDYEGAPCDEGSNWFSMWD